MKPMIQLKAARTGVSARTMIEGFLAILRNPKRHLRGPRLGLKPGTGKVQHDNDMGNVNTAVCGCAMGILDVVQSSDAYLAHAVRVETNERLNAAAAKLFPNETYVSVSDRRGLQAIRKVAKLALANLRGG